MERCQSGLLWLVANKLYVSTVGSNPTLSDLEFKKNMDILNFKPFLAWHIIKWDKERLFYSWDITELPNTVDSAFCHKWFSDNKEFMNWREVAVSIYGDILHIKIPIFKDKVDTAEYVDVTDEYKKLLNTYMKSWVISDRRWWVMFKVLDKLELWNYNNVFLFKKKKTVELLDIKETQVTAEISWEVINIWEELDTRYKSLLLLIKEVQDWYRDVRKHYLAERSEQKKQFVQQDYKLWEDIEIVLDWQTVVEVKQKPTEYDGIKTRQGWVVEWPDGEQTPVEDFEQVKTFTDDMGYKHYILVWAYTHVLRQMLKFDPQTWQYKFLVNFNRINFVAWSRRAGKTLLSAYLVLRQLWMMPFSSKHMSRPIKTAYIAPTEDKFKEVLDYISEMSEKVKALKIVEYIARDKRLILKDEIVERWKKTISAVSTCDFASGKWFEPARWKASDLVIIDEAAFVGEDVWLNILPILETEWASFYWISTIDWNSPRNWFYENLIEYERGFDPEWYGMRVTIDDIDERLVTDIQKARMKRALKHNPQRYYAELYATFPDMTQVFNTEWFFRISSDLAAGESVSEIVIGYDPAKRTDVWAVVVAEIRNNGYMQIIEEYWLQWEYTTKQKPFISQLKQKWMSQYPTTLIIDATWVWDVVAEIFGNLVDYKIWYTAQWNRPTVDDYWAWKVPKSGLVHTAQILMEKNAMKADIKLTNLMEELKYFKSFTTNAGNVRYEAEVWHDDYVNAMMLISFYYANIKWEIHNLKNDNNNIMRDRGIDPWTGLYNSYSAREFMQELPESNGWFNFYI